MQHGPLPRAAETARVVAEQFASQVPVRQFDAAGDYVPPMPEPDEVAREHTDDVFAFVADVSSSEAAHGATLADEAIRLLTRPEQGVSVLTGPANVGKSTTLLQLAKEVEARAERRTPGFRADGRVPVVFIEMMPGPRRKV